MSNENHSSSSSTKTLTSSSKFVTTATTPPLIYTDFTISKITNFIKITLSIEKGQYNTWYELFKIHALVQQVIDHIILIAPPSSFDLKTINHHLWHRLEVGVIQWIYFTQLYSAIQLHNKHGTGCSTSFMTTKILGLST